MRLFPLRIGSDLRRLLWSLPGLQVTQETSNIYIKPVGPIDRIDQGEILVILIVLNVSEPCWPEFLKTSKNRRHTKDSLRKVC